jgi:hypothetical protein
MLPKILKVFLSIKYINAVILPRFYKIKIKIISSYAIVLFSSFKSLKPIIYINGVIMFI